LKKLYDDRERVKNGQPFTEIKDGQARMKDERKHSIS
jgi:hypothetical protein